MSLNCPLYLNSFVFLNCSCRLWHFFWCFSLFFSLRWRESWTMAPRSDLSLQEKSPAKAPSIQGKACYISQVSPSLIRDTPSPKCPHAAASCVHVPHWGPQDLARYTYSRVLSAYSSATLAFNEATVTGDDEKISRGTRLCVFKRNDASHHFVSAWSSQPSQMFL